MNKRALSTVIPTTKVGKVVFAVLMILAVATLQQLLSLKTELGCNSDHRGNRQDVIKSKSTTKEKTTSISSSLQSTKQNSTIRIDDEQKQQDQERKGILSSYLRKGEGDDDDDYDVYPLISAIIPFHKFHHHTIFQAIYSVTNQTYPNIEVIVIDASKDPRAKLALEGRTSSLNDTKSNDTTTTTNNNNNNQHEYSPIFSRPVKVVRHKKKLTVQSVNRNVGILASKGKYIASLDADDAWFPHKLYDQMVFAKLYDLKFFGSEASIARKCRDDGNGTFVPWDLSVPSPKQSYPELYNGVKFKDILGQIKHAPIRDGATLPARWDASIVKWHNMAITSTVVIEKQLLLDAGMFSEPTSVNQLKNKKKETGEDGALWRKILKKFPNETMGYLDKTTTVYDKGCHGWEDPNSKLYIPPSYHHHP